MWFFVYKYRVENNNSFTNKFGVGRMFLCQADNFEQIESEGNIVINKENEKIIATIGLENIVIVNTKDALLVCHKDKSQKVKKILNKIEMKNK